MQKLDIDDLTAICAIAESGSVTRAADRMRLSQSAVSHKISRLEARLQCQILARKSSDHTFTSDGQTLLEYAKRILSLHDEAISSLAHSSLSGTLRLGMTEDITSGDLSNILGKFARRHPNVQVRTHVSQSLTLEDQLARGKIDIAIMQIFSENVIASDIVLFEDSLHWVKSRDFSLPTDRPVPFLAFDSNCFYKVWAMELALENKKFEVVFECSSTAGITSALEAGLGISLLNRRNLSRNLEIVDDLIGFQPPKISYIIRFAKRGPRPAMQSLAELIVQERAAYPLDSGHFRKAS